MPERPSDRRTTPGDAAFGGQHGSLEALWDEVVRARREVAAERHDPQHHVGPTARIALIDALEAYIDAIRERGHPTPYPLANELRMQRLATAPARGDR